MVAVTARDTGALIEALWAGFAPVVEARLVAIDLGISVLAAGAARDDARVAEAHRAAHALAGALGSYGRGSAGVTARRLMEALEAAQPDTATLRPLAAALREDLR